MTNFYKNALNLFLPVIILFLCVSCVSATRQEPDKKSVPNVIIIVLGGVRNSESIDEATRQYIPYLSNDIFKEGTLYTNVLATDFEYHMPAIHAIITGKHYNHYPGVTAPTLFQYLRKRYNLPSQKVVSIGQWDENDCFYVKGNFGADSSPCGIAVVSSTYSPEMKKVLTPSELTFFDTLRNFMEKKLFPEPFTCLHWDALGEITHRIFKRTLQEFKPKLAFYVMAGVESSHYSTFGRYVIALKRSDEMIDEVWNMIQSDPFYKDNTYLIICPDHARDSYYMEHFENCYDNPSRVWMYIYGPRINKGNIINRPIYHVDIFATVSYIMHLEVPLQEGKVLEDSFR